MDFGGVVGDGLESITRGVGVADAQVSARREQQDSNVASFMRSFVWFGGGLSAEVSRREIRLLHSKLPTSPFGLGR